MAFEFESRSETYAEMLQRGKAAHDWLYLAEAVSIMKRDSNVTPCDAADLKRQFRDAIYAVIDEEQVQEESQFLNLQTNLDLICAPEGAATHEELIWILTRAAASPVFDPDSMGQLLEEVEIASDEITKAMSEGGDKHD